MFITENCTCYKPLIHCTFNKADILNPPTLGVFETWIPAQHTRREILYNIFFFFFFFFFWLSAWHYWTPYIASVTEYTATMNMPDNCYITRSELHWLNMQLNFQGLKDKSMIFTDQYWVFRRRLRSIKSIKYWAVHLMLFGTLNVIFNFSSFGKVRKFSGFSSLLSHNCLKVTYLTQLYNTWHSDSTKFVLQ